MRRIKDAADEDIYECLMSRLPSLNVQLLDKKAIGWTRQHQIAGYRQGDTIAIGNWLSAQRQHDTIVHEFGHWLQDAVLDSVSGNPAAINQLWEEHAQQSVGHYVGCSWQHNINKYELFACAFECYINDTHTPYGERVVLATINPRRHL